MKVKRSAERRQRRRRGSAYQVLELVAWVSLIREALEHDLGLDDNSDHISGTAEAAS